MKTFFYHSDPILDPRGRGKRMTICGIADGNILRFGHSITHVRFDSFDRKNGRWRAEMRARSHRPCLVMEIQGNPKHHFLKHAKELVAARLDSKYYDEGETSLFSKKLAENRKKLIGRIIKDLKGLKVLDHWLGNDTVLVSKDNPGSRTLGWTVERLRPVPKDKKRA